MNDAPRIHSYIGRAPCGCAIMVVSVDAHETAARMCAEVIRDGGVVWPVTKEQYEEARKEPTFFKCAHVARQEPLFT